MCAFLSVCRISISVKLNTNVRFRIIMTYVAYGKLHDVERKRGRPCKENIYFINAVFWLYNSKIKKYFDIHLFHEVRKAQNVFITIIIFRYWNFGFFHQNIVYIWFYILFYTRSQVSIQYAWKIGFRVDFSISSTWLFIQKDSEYRVVSRQIISKFMCCFMYDDPKYDFNKTNL